MAVSAPTDEGISVRRALTWALVVALCVAAFTACVAILNGDFDDTDARVIGTSLGFAIFSATAAAGASLRFRDSGSLRTLGFVTMALSAASFLSLLPPLWGDDADETWRLFGSLALAALAASHASLMAGAMRPGDSAGVRALCQASIALAVIDSFCGILAVTGAVEDLDEGLAQFMAVLVILLVLTTALTPILRRLERSDAVPQPASAANSVPHPLAGELLAAADRIDALTEGVPDRAPEIHRECERLRQIARLHSR